MEVISSGEGRELTLTLRGELDHHAAKEAMRKLEWELDAALPSKLTLDFSGVSFMDSSGAPWAAALRSKTFRRRRKKCLPPREFSASYRLRRGKRAMKVKPNNYIAIEFPSRSVNEGLARAAVAAFAAQLDPTLDELGDIKTAVSEAVTNAIVHAYPQEIGKIALRACIFDGNLLEITVRDWGCGIADVEKAREPLYTTGGEERSGMGFTIMESFMDSLAVRSKNGKGTVVTMKRRIALRTARR